MDRSNSEEEKQLSEQQRRHIEDLVQLSPVVIKARVRRDALSASEVLGAYAGTASNARRPQAKGTDGSLQPHGS